MERRLIRISLYVIIVLIVWFGWKFTNNLIEANWFSCLELSKELSPIDLLDLIVTTIVTLVLAWFVTKKLTEDRYKKELIINDLKSIEEQISNIEKLAVQECRVDLQSQLNNLTYLLSTIRKFKSSIKIMDIECNKVHFLEHYYWKLYKETTNVDGDTVDFKELDRISLDSCCTNFILTTREIMCSINKY